MDPIPVPTRAEFIEAAGEVLALSPEEAARMYDLLTGPEALFTAVLNAWMGDVGTQIAKEG